MKLTSTAFADGGSIPRQFTCDGDGVPPPLTVSDIPSGTVSLSLVVTDPDAPGGIFTHWVKRGISPGSADLSGGSEDRNSAGTSGWYPPCPPSGIHRYVFEVLALDPGDRLLASAKLTGMYGRAAV